MIANPIGVLAVLSGVAAFFFYLEKNLKWKFFTYVPPLLFIYSTPVLLTNTGILPKESEVYTWMSSLILPFVLVLLLLNVDIKNAFRKAGRGMFLVIIAMMGVVLGAPIGFLLVRSHLGPEGWKAFGTLAGSWIGGTGNMAAVAEMIQASGTEFGLAVLADNALFILWLPLLLLSKNFAVPFARFTGAKRSSIDSLKSQESEGKSARASASMHHYIYLLCIGLVATWIATTGSQVFPELKPIITASTWKILLVTTIGVLLSFTPARKIPASYEFAMAFVYLFVANMGAKANVSGLAAQAPWFLLGSLVWIVFHGLICILGAKLLKLDVHMTALASAVNIGGVASAPIVAAHHHPSLVPVSILTALFCYSLANYMGWLTAILCRALS